jgi:hypothetical protein
MELRDKLTMIATDYDRKYNGDNIYALGIILKRIDEYVMPAIEGGTSPARALYDNFNDRLLGAFEKALKLPRTFGGGGKDRGRPA